MESSAIIQAPILGAQGFQALSIDDESPHQNNGSPTWRSNYQHYHMQKML